MARSKNKNKRSEQTMNTGSMLSRVSLAQPQNSDNHRSLLLPGSLPCLKRKMITFYTYAFARHQTHSDLDQIKILFFGLVLTYDFSQFQSQDSHLQ